jgi:hypothetical protein
MAMAIIMTPPGIYDRYISKITLKTIITILKKGIEPMFFVKDYHYDYHYDRTIFKLDTSLLIEKKPLSKYTYKYLYRLCEHEINAIHNMINEFRNRNECNIESCPVCLDDITSSTNTCTTNCGHTFCSPCFITILNNGVNNREIRVNCPMCRTSIIH